MALHSFLKYFHGQNVLTVQAHPQISKSFVSFYLGFQTCTPEGEKAKKMMRFAHVQPQNSINFNVCEFIQLVFYMKTDEKLYY